MTRKLTLAHSPDADDAFMFYALAENLIDTKGWEFEHILQDIQTLNERAARGELDITAVSIHAYSYIADRYALMSCGASMGDNYGPMVVTKDAGVSVADLKKRVIAVPGLRTSAYMSLCLALGKEQPVVAVPFDEILEGVRDGKYEAGLLIHEGQLTYQEEGLHSVINLGEWWFERTGGLPLPLGGNVIRRDFGDEAIREIDGILRESIRYGLEHRDEAVRHSMKWGRGLEQERTDKFVGMYVNELTLDYGERGRKAIELFLDEGVATGVIPSRPARVFAVDPPAESS
jgi:1,4-dihydroxy-6-naphthoate synthase